MESGKVKGGVEEDDKDTQQGGVEAVGVRLFFQIRHSVGAALRCGDMGGYPPHGPVSGGFPGPGGVAIDEEDPAEASRREVGVHLGGGGKVVGGVWDDGYAYLSKAENGRAVHCYAIASENLWGNREDARGAGGDSVVGAGGHWYGRGKVDGGFGGGRGKRWWAGR